jgi:hypothetical protein
MFGLMMAGPILNQAMQMAQQMQQQGSEGASASQGGGGDPAQKLFHQILQQEKQG